MSDATEHAGTNPQTYIDSPTADGGKKTFNAPIAHTQLENHAHGSVLCAIDSGERDAQRDADCSE